MRWIGIRKSAVVMLIAIGGCNTSKPFIAIGPALTPAADASAAVQPVATADLGTVASVPGVNPKPKPFVAIPKPQPILPAWPSTLLLEHAVPESPVPLTDYAKQPVHWLHDFNLTTNLSAAQVEKTFGPPAQLADNEEYWYVYRLTLRRELWLHFVGPDRGTLVAADVVRPAEDGYVRDRVFDADASPRFRIVNGDGD
jgi:hypothetical protein